MDYSSSINSAKLLHVEAVAECKNFPKATVCITQRPGGSYFDITGSSVASFCVSATALFALQQAAHNMLELIENDQTTSH